MSRRRPFSSRLAPLLLGVVLFLLTTIVSDAADDKCGSKTFSCPHCGGINVTDCFDCDGYLSTDRQHNMCINRKLFQPHNTDQTNHDNHYHFLWNDLVGMVVWFLTAGVATACGVGGGGIYVPMGILLLGFAPKQASGLSQASIFGASLGGFSLNVRDQHPNTKIRDDPGIPDEKEGHTRTIQAPEAPRDDTQKGGLQQSQQQERKYYTRPLINYDMALFLAPMEMAGAVLGVLVQKILPNWLYLLVAGLVLSITSYKTYQKFFKARAKEKQAEQAQNEQQAATEEAAPVENNDTLDSVENQDTPESLQSASPNGLNNEENATPPPTGNNGSSHLEKPESPSNDEENATQPATENTNNGSSHLENQDDDDQELALRKKYLEDDMRQYPREKLAALAILWVGLFVLTLMKGGKGVESLVGITCESPWYAVLIVLQFLWIFGFAVYFGYRLLVKQTEREKVRYPYLPDDPVWNKKALRFYGVFTFIAGVVAGLIGIGGGMVLGPLVSNSSL